MLGEIHCPLCSAVAVSPYSSDERRPYLQCENCCLVFVPSDRHLSREAERAEYDLHQNSVEDVGYRTFLSRLMLPLAARLPPGAKGLDFGCGPGPALAAMLQEAQFEVALYDSFYAPDKSRLEVSYDFICATEVIEHLHRPGMELERLWSLLLPGGWLGIMTKLVRDRVAFDKWHYKNDLTHVCFFSAETWHWWAREHRAGIEIIGSDVILLQRRG